MRVSDLKDTERRIYDAVLTGRLVDLRRDESGAPAIPDDKRVRADVLAHIITTAGPGAVAIRVCGADIVGHLNLGGRRIRVPVELGDCTFSGRVQFAKTQLPELSLRGSVFPHGISARGLRLSGALNVTDCKFGNRLYLKRLGAEIVFMDGVVVRGSGEYAIQLRGADVRQELYFRNGVVTNGCVTLYGARIGGQLVMDDSSVDWPHDTALVAPNLDVGQDLRLRGISIIGRTDLAKAKVGGDFAMNRAFLDNPEGQALRMDMVHVEQNASLHDGFHANGEVSLFLANVEGRLELDGAHLSNPGEKALDLSRVEVGQSAILTGTRVHGGIKAYGVTVGSNLSMNRIMVYSPDVTAIEVVQGSIGQSLLLDEGVRVHGEVDLSNTAIAQRFRFADAGMTRLNASELSMAILDDDPKCWPQTSAVGGMQYDRLPEDERGSPRARIRWLQRLLPRYSPQPYSQLVGVYLAAGSTTAARMVMMAKEDARRRNHRNPWRRIVSRVWGFVLRMTVGYGHAPWRAIGWALGLYLAAWLVFATAPEAAFSARTAVSGEFQPSMYALDTVLPVVRISAGNQWLVHGGYAWAEAGFAAGGWFLSLVVTAGVTGVFRRDRA